MKKYLILPGCSDLNRGDEALVWLTKEFAEEAGYKGEYYMLVSDDEPTEQSIREGLGVRATVLKHPSRIQKKGENLHYGLRLKLLWGVVAVWDLFTSFLLLFKTMRKLFGRFFSAEKQATLKTMEESDAVFVKGGGFVHAYGGLTGFYYMYYVLYHILLAQRMGKNVYIMPNSFGPFRGVGVKPLVRKVLKDCRFLSARENISACMAAEDLGIEMETYPDLAFFLTKREKDVSALFANCGDRKRVAVTMRPYRFPEQENGQALYKEFQSGMRTFLEWLYESGHMPVVVEHTRAVNAHENDKHCIEEVLRDVPKERYCLISDSSLDCRDLKNIYANCDYIVGTRFHSVIFSVSEGVPAVAITYGGNKGAGIMQDMGLSDLAIPIENVTAETLKEAFAHLVENEADVRARIGRYLDESQKKKELLLEKIAEG